MSIIVTCKVAYEVFISQKDYKVIYADLFKEIKNY